MTTIICGTIRQNSISQIVSDKLHSIYQDKGLDAKVLSLHSLPSVLLSHDAFVRGKLPTEVHEIYDEYFSNTDSFHFVIPEYNGSFPGALKHLIDVMSLVGDFKQTFNGKRAALVGLGSGRAGNLRGIEHFVGILHYLRVNVLPNHVLMPQVGSLLVEGKLEADTVTNKMLEEQVAALGEVATLK